MDMQAATIWLELSCLNLHVLPIVKVIMHAGLLLQTGLKNRGFEVVRLNTYDTQPVSQVEEGLLQQACQAAVVAFASPSAVK